LSGVRQGCGVAPDLFLVPMDWLVERIPYMVAMWAPPLVRTRNPSLTSISPTTWSYLQRCCLCLSSTRSYGQGSTPSRPDHQLGQDQNPEPWRSRWGKPDAVYHSSREPGGSCRIVHVPQRINIVREAMFTLDQNIWRTSITLETKLRLYNTCILPIFLYGAETWSYVTVILSKKIDALDSWCPRQIMNIPLVRICHQ